MRGMRLRDVYWELRKYHGEAYACVCLGVSSLSHGGFDDL